MCGSDDPTLKHLNDSVSEGPSRGLLSPLDGYALPGHGEGSSDCGNTRWFHCPDCGHVFEGTRRCDKSTCPNCWRRWAFKLGKRSGLRLWAARKIIMGSKRGGRLLHIVVSIKYNGEDLNEIKRKVYGIARDHKICGGAVVFHHTRVRDDADGRVPDGYVHYHLIGLAKGHVLPGNGDGYIFHVIRDAIRHDYRGFQRTREVIACLSYLLTHAAVSEKKHTLTWFGDMSYNKLNNATLEEHSPELMSYLNRSGLQCPQCGERNCQSLWDVEYELNRREDLYTDYIERPALALEYFGLDLF